MKMGTIASPWRYDVAAAQAIKPDNRRRTAILRYTSWTAVFPISRVVRLPFDCGHSINPGNGAMGHLLTLGAGVSGGPSIRISLMSTGPWQAIAPYTKKLKR